MRIIYINFKGESICPQRVAKRVGTPLNLALWKLIMRSCNIFIVLTHTRIAGTRVLAQNRCINNGQMSGTNQHDS